MLKEQIITDYTKSLLLTQTAGEVFTCISERIQEWWTEVYSGSSSARGDEFTVRFDKSFKTFRIADSIVPEVIVWTCKDAWINVPELTDKREWTGTKIVWEISSVQGGTNLQLTHVGLTREMECYDLCEKGWDYFLASLEKLISTGTGNPFKKDHSG